MPVDYFRGMTFSCLINGGRPTKDFHPIQFASTVWRNDSQQVAHKTLRIESIDLSSGFHKYAAKWEPNKMTFYFEGQAFHNVNASFSKQKFIVLSLQFGSASGPGASGKDGFSLLLFGDLGASLR